MKINGKLTGDTGWIIATLTSDFAPYSNNSNYTPRYRKIGNIVHIVGIVTPTTTMASTTERVIFTLPEGYRPSLETKMVCQGSSMNRWLLNVAVGGSVTLSRYGVNSQDNISAGNWLPFSITFFVD